MRKQDTIAHYGAYYTIEHESLDRPFGDVHEHLGRESILPHLPTEHANEYASYRDASLVIEKWYFENALRDVEDLLSKHLDGMSVISEEVESVFDLDDTLGYLEDEGFQEPLSIINDFDDEDGMDDRLPEDQLLADIQRITLDGRENDIVLYCTVHAPTTELEESRDTVKNLLIRAMDYFRESDQLESAGMISDVLDNVPTPLLKPIPENINIHDEPLLDDLVIYSVCESEYGDVSVQKLRLAFQEAIGNEEGVYTPFYKAVSSTGSCFATVAIADETTMNPSVEGERIYIARCDDEFESIQFFFDSVSTEKYLISQYENTPCPAIISSELTRLHKELG